ncbi:MAG: hypothetical protein ACOCUF_01940 [Patescibacteria group bacterium]
MENQENREGNLTKIKNTLARFWQKPLLASIAVFFLFFGVFSLFYLKAPGTLTIDDQYFHFRLADMIKEEGLSSMKDFDRIYFSEQRAEGEPRKVQLFNIFQIPFTYFEDSFFGLKFSAIFWASLTLSIIYYLFRKLKVPYSLLFTLLFFTSFTILSRFLINRGLVLIMGLMFLEVYFLIKQKHKSFLFAGFFHVLWHLSTFPAPIILALATETVRYILNKKFSLKLIILSIVAVSLGAITYPAFPDNVLSVSQNVININKNIIEENAVSKIAGQELALIDPSFLVENVLVVTALAIFSIIFCIFFYVGLKKNWKNYQYKVSDHFLLISFLIMIGSLAGILILSGRFFDFFFVSAVFTFALAVKKIKTDKNIVISSNYKNYFLAFCLIFLLFLGQNELINVKRSAYDKELLTKKQVAKWIEDRAEEGDIVFTRSWNHFPIQFFFNQKVRYTMGIEPMTLKKHNEDLFWKWYNIRVNTFYCDENKNCQDKVKEIKNQIKNHGNKINEFQQANSLRIIETIQEDFQSRFVLSANKDLNKILLLNEDKFEEHKTFESRKGTEFFVGKLK